MANSSASNLALFGYSAGKNTTGGQNSFFGGFAGTSETSGTYNTCLGYNSCAALTTGGFNTVVGGQANVLNNNDTDEIVIGESAVGNGSHTVTIGSSTVTTTILRGNVGIGTASLSSTLFIQGTGSTNPLVVASSTASQLMSVNSAGQLAVNSLVSCGGVTTNANGLMSCSSDARLKDIQGPFTAGLDAIMQINPQTYSWATGTAMYDGGVQYSGFIAQNVQQALPQAVTAGSNGYLQISQLTIEAALVNAVKQQQAEIITLQGGLNGNATSSDLAVYIPSNFSGDSVGEAEIPAGQTSVRVSFSQPYACQPIVTVTAVDYPTYGYVSDVDASGFTVNLPLALASDVTFDWHSFASPQEQLTVMGAPTQPIALVAATSTPASEQQLTVIPDTTSSSPQPVAEPDSLATSSPVDLSSSTPADENPADSTTTLSTASSPSPAVLGASRMPSSAAADSASPAESTPTPVATSSSTPMPSAIPAASPTPTPQQSSPAQASTSSEPE